MIRRVLAALAALLGGLALFVSGPHQRAMKTISPLELAEWIHDRKPGLRIIDLRTEAEFDEYHVPRAEHVSIESAHFKASETIVLVGANASTTLDEPSAYLLRGGVQGWIDDVLNPTIAADAPPDARATFKRVSEVSRYFGGIPRIVDKGQPVKANTAATVRRRGC